MRNPRRCQLRACHPEGAAGDEESRSDARPARVTLKEARVMRHPKRCQLRACHPEGGAGDEASEAMLAPRVSP